MTIIPCIDLSVGSWRRIATTESKHDLVAYVCETKRCLTWFIHSDGYGFKMEIPFSTIVKTEFTNASPGSGLASFFLSQPPIFYLENLCQSAGAEKQGPPRSWKRCTDWTEGHQASLVLQHDLVGSAVQLAHLLRNLRAAESSNLEMRAQSAYHTELPPVELPPPPMAGLCGPAYHYRVAESESPRPEPPVTMRSRSYTVTHSHYPHSSQSSPSSASSHNGEQPCRGPSYSSSSYISSPVYTEYGTLVHNPAIDEYGTGVPTISQRASAPHRGSYCMPSPPLLTTPFHPHIESPTTPYSSDAYHFPRNDGQEEMISSMPVMVYKQEEDDMHHIPH